MPLNIIFSCKSIFLSTLMIFPSQIVDHEYDCLIGNEFTKIKLSDIKTKYIVLIFYPLDFTFVCPTEITKFSDLHDEFKKLDCTVIFSSCDSKYSHMAWSKMSREQGGIGEIKWPMISDINRKLCTQFNLFNEQSGCAIRSTVVLDQTLNVVHISANIDPIGRSTSEILRLLKALDFYKKNQTVCYVDFDG